LSPNPNDFVSFVPSSFIGEGRSCGPTRILDCLMATAIKPVIKPNLNLNLN